MCTGLSMCMSETILIFILLYFLAQPVRQTQIYIAILPLLIDAKRARPSPPQMQIEPPAQPAAHHLDRDRVPQRGVDHTAAHRVERHQPVAATAAAGDHSGGRCQRARVARSQAGGLRAHAAGAHVRAAHGEPVRADSGATARRQACDGESESAGCVFVLFFCLLSV